MQALNCSIEKGARISEEMEFRESFSLTERNPKHFSIQTVRLVYYTGNLSDRDRVDEDECEFSPSLAHVPRSDVF